MTVTTPAATFKVFRQFNRPELRIHTGHRGRLDDRVAAVIDGNGLPDKIARALCDSRAIPTKELFESFEFWSRVRRRLRRPVVADLCSGQGLTGIVFAAMEREVERVILVDTHIPDSLDVVLSAVGQVCPWVPDKVTVAQERLEDVEIPKDAAVIGVHACGVRTDGVLARAAELHAPFAVMPCCYHQTGRNGPTTLRKALGVETATDVDRTYRMRQLGYEVDWSAIPDSVTPKCRILIGRPTPS